MRLGQISRKLGVKSSEVIQYIEKEFNQEIKNHPNCKIPDELVDKIESHFARPVDPEKDHKDNPGKDDKLDSGDIPKNEVDKEVVEVFEDETKKGLASSKNEDAERLKGDLVSDEKSRKTDREIANEVLADSSDPENEIDLNVVDGVIKAPKVEAQGIRVVGKIDLPQEKVEEEVEKIDDDHENIPHTPSEEDESVQEKKSDKEPKKERKATSDKGKSGRKKAKREDEVSYDEQKRRELEKYRKEQEKKRKAAKEAKRKNYESKIKSNKNTLPKEKSRKKKATKKETTGKSENIKQQEPTTTWGKFLRWLNT
ncbi:MAG: hypothetical protein R3277_06350 [Brumimicrobium sp.]|nr:hypothetical protein [Brumimicrobium sp.]